MERVADRLELQDLEVLISAEEFEHRKAWMQFGEDDVVRLKELNSTAQDYADEVIGDLYDHFLGFDETRRFFEDPDTLTYVKKMQKEYFLRLTNGSYGPEYVSDRLKIGAVHERIGLDVKWYLGAYNRYLRSVATRIFQDTSGQAKEVLATYFSLEKLVFIDIGLAIDTYISSREVTIREQQEAIRELSTPVLQVREGLLILPVIGVIDGQRARQLTEQVLRAVRGTRARVVVMDITGVPTVDSQVANHLVQTVDAARLMGANVIVTGLSAEVAQTLVTIGVELGKLNTVGDLQGGIEAAERMLGYRVVRDERAAMSSVPKNDGEASKIFNGLTR